MINPASKRSSINDADIIPMVATTMQLRLNVNNQGDSFESN